MPWVGWRERAGASLPQARVARLNANAHRWEEPAGAGQLNAAGTGASTPRLTAVDGIPYVAYGEDGALRVRRFEPSLSAPSALVGEDGATLQADVRTYGLEYRVGFAVGAIRTAATPFAAVAPLTQIVGGLAAGTTYAARAYALAGDGAPPILGPAADLTTRAATGSGPAGPQGPAGADGAPGPQGPAGGAGPTGAQGVAGTPGAAGPSGGAGRRGPAGPRGAQGAPGTSPRLFVALASWRIAGRSDAPLPVVFSTSAAATVRIYVRRPTERGLGRLEAEHRFRRARRSAPRLRLQTPAGRLRPHDHRPQRQPEGDGQRAARAALSAIPISIWLLCGVCAYKVDSRIWKLPSTPTRRAPARSRERSRGVSTSSTASACCGPVSPTGSRSGGIVLCGLRGMGKTVLLREMARDARENGWRVSFVEMRRGTDLRDAFTAAALEQLAGLQHSRAGDRCLLARDGMIRALRATVAPEVQIDVDVTDLLTVGRSLEADPGELLARLGTPAREQEIGVAFVVDELQELDDEGSPRSAPRCTASARRSCRSRSPPPACRAFLGCSPRRSPAPSGCSRTRRSACCRMMPRAGRSSSRRARSSVTPRHRSTPMRSSG